MLAGIRQAAKRRFGLYRFLPLFFLTGAAIELFMIKVRVGKETFYDTVVRKEAERRQQRQIEEESHPAVDSTSAQ